MTLTIRPLRAVQTALILTLALLLGCATAGGDKKSSRQATPFLPWNDLQNPVLGYPDWSIKDSSCAYHDGVFHLFFSAFYQNAGEIRSHVVQVTTPDFKTFSEPLMNISGLAEGWIGMCSPNVTRVGDTWYLCFNSWGDKKDKPNQLFYMESNDLKNWSPRKPLAANLTAGKRAIDAAIAFANNKYYLVWKDDKHQARLASAPAMDAPFNFVGDGYPQFLMAAGGKDNGLIHENYQFMNIDGQWHVLSTDYRPHALYLYKLTGTGTTDEDWLKWEQGNKLEIASQAFNTAMNSNAACMADWRQHDGWFYLFYAGTTENESFKKRGNNKLGLARSKDLVNWQSAREKP